MECAKLQVTPAVPATSVPLDGTLAYILITKIQQEGWESPGYGQHSKPEQGRRPSHDCLFDTGVDSPKGIKHDGFTRETAAHS